MFFVGIVTDSNSERVISNTLKNENIIFIKDSNIENMKNIKFDTIILNKNLNDYKIMKHIIKKARYLLINFDKNININEFNNIQSNIITYGLNSKSTVTISSRTDENLVVSIQRNIQKNNDIIELQDINVVIKNQHNTYDIMLITLYYLLYEPEKAMKIELL